MLLIMIMVMIIWLLDSTRNRACHSRAESSLIPLHLPYLLLFLNQLIHRIIIVYVDMYLLVEEFFVALFFFLGEALITETVGANENPHILKVILLLLYVFLTFHY